MKKTLIAAAFMAAMAGASAAEVSVYGIIDMGLSFSRQGGDNGDDKISTAMKSGMRNSSRVGLKGSEDLGGGWKAGFILESQFLADDGSLQTSGRLWERESSVWISSPFGKVTAGRVGYLKGVVGSTALLNSYRVNPFGSLMSNFVSGYKPYTTGTTWSTNNGVVYQTPTVANTTAYLQYANAVNDEGDGYNDDDRYFAAAVRYLNGPLLLQAIVDTTNRGRDASLSDTENKDPKSLGLQAAYDFGAFKTFVMFEAFQDSALNSVGGYLKGTGLYDGAGGTLVVQWPMAGGQAKIGAGFMKASSNDDASADKDNDVTRFGASVGYDYVLTKRTHLYTDYGYILQKTEYAGDAPDVKDNGMELTMGMVHYF